MGKPSDRSRQARDRILGELRRELMGPSESDEVIKEFPSARYIVVRLRAGEETRGRYRSSRAHRRMAKHGGERTLLMPEI